MPARMRLPATAVLITALVCAGAVPPVAGAIELPVPCNGGQPAYAAAGPQPDIRVYYGDELGPKWAPASCAGWEPVNVAILVVTAGSFHHAGTAADIAGRFGTISQYHDIRYWSHTREVWRPLMPESYALSGPDPKLRRADFTAQEMVAGAPLHFYQTASGKFAYRLQVREHDADHLVVSMENITGVQMLFLPVFRPGDARLVYFVEREQGDLWNYYALIALSGPFAPFMRSGESSFINRAAAIFRYAAGLPTDAEPPIAPN